MPTWQRGAFWTKTKTTWSKCTNEKITGQSRRRKRPRAKSRHQIEQKKVDKLCEAREYPGQNVRCSGAKSTFTERVSTHRIALGGHATKLN